MCVLQSSPAGVWVEVGVVCSYRAGPPGASLLHTVRGPLRSSAWCLRSVRTCECKMSGLDPLKSAISYENQDDTSLALPSVNQYRSGAQRVRDQVQTIKRTKSRQFSTKSGSTSLSPTSKSRKTAGFNKIKEETFYLWARCGFFYFPVQNKTKQWFTRKLFVIYFKPAATKEIRFSDKHHNLF